MKRQLICNGDSWVFGSEIVDPELAKQYPVDVHVGNYDHKKENDHYRLPRIFPTKLADKLNADAINLSWPADDNQSICNRTIEFITKNYINTGLGVDHLFVVIGWSSPERVRFWYKDDERNQKFIIWPSLEWFDTQAQEKFWRLYVAYMWNKEEFIPRYVDTVLRFQNFCNEHGIKFVMFNAFYQGQGSGCSHAIEHDFNVEQELTQLAVEGYDYSINNVRQQGVSFSAKHAWATVDKVRYYNKDAEKNSFRTFITDNLEKPLQGWHPSELGHSIWADELFRYINENNLI